MSEEKKNAPQELNENELGGVSGGLGLDFSTAVASCMDCGRDIRLTGDIIAAYGKGVLCRNCEARRRSEGRLNRG